MRKYRLQRFLEKITQIIFLLLILLPITYNLSPITCSYAAVPHLINYQGRLTDTSGTPLNGSYALTFRIYDAEAAGNLLWEEIQSSVVIQKGIFSIMLGSVTSLDLPFDKAYFLEIKVGSEVMSPRQKITSAGYAIKAETAEQAQNATTVANVGVSTTPTANKILPLDANAKFPLSVLGLKVYDSGWFAISEGNAYLKTHNLGTTKIIAMVWGAKDGSGTGAAMCAQSVWDRYETGGGGYHQGIGLTNLTTTQVSLRVSTPCCFDAGGNFAATYARIILLALE